MDNILDALSEKLDCRNYGNYLAAICIFHQDSRPSLMIYPDTYRCLSCGAFGKTSDLLNKLSNTALLLTNTKHDFTNPFSRWLRNDTIENVCRKSHSLMTNQPSLGQYLHKRGIAHPEQYGIGYRDDWYTFPITDQDSAIIGAVARANADTNTSKSKYVIPHGQDPNYLYIPDWKLIDKASTVYLTFGILDALSLVIMGYPAMSTTTGKRLAPEALDWLRKRIVIIPDEGETPDAIKIAKQLGWRGAVKQITYPDGTKDISGIFNSTRQLIPSILG